MPGLDVAYADTEPLIELPYLIDHTRIAREFGVTHRDPEAAYRELAAVLGFP